jgi:hypothetical protein
MRSAKLFLLGMTTVATLYGATVANAAIVDDPLHGWCPAASCVDNGAITPLGTNTTFGWQSSPAGLAGTLYIEVLIPSNNVPATIPSISGTNDGTSVPTTTPTLVTGIPPGPWTTGTLAAYLGGIFAGGSPNNPIGAFLPLSQQLVSGITGYSVFQLNAGTNTGMSGTSTSPPNDVFTSSASYPLGSVLVAFLIESDGTAVATANSGGLIVNGTRPPPIPLPGALPLFVTGLVGLGVLGYRRRRKDSVGELTRA